MLQTHKFLKQFYLGLEELKNDPISDSECIFEMANNGVCICDAPVGSTCTMKCITSHTGYHSCERCTVNGQFDEHVRHVCFLDVDCCLCTDLDAVQQLIKIILAFHFWLQKEFVQYQGLCLIICIYAA